MFIRLLFSVWLLSTGLYAQAETEVSALSQQLQSLKQQIHTEQKQSEQWIKALNRVAQRIQKRLDQIPRNVQSKAKQTLLDMQQTLQKKQQLLARHRVKLADTQNQIPAWLSLMAANQVNHEMQKKINDAELLLQSAQKLDIQDWLIRTPEELWKELEVKEQGL